MAERAVLRAGVIGVGHLGRLHASKYAAAAPSAGVELVAVYDRDAAAAARVAAAGDCRAASDLDDLLAEVDLVSIAVPASAHVAVGKRTAAAGVHMLMEKPLAPDAPAAREIAAAAEAAGVVLQVGHLERFNPVMDEVRSLVRRPRFVECHRLAPFAGRGSDAHVVVDVMIHDLDLLAFLVGEPIAEVHAVGVPILSDTVDIANARIRFAGGCIANVTASRVSLKRERKLRIFQQDAYVSLDLEARSATIARKRDAESVARGPASPMDAICVETRELAGGDPLAAEVDAFVAAVRGGTPPVVGAREAIDALEMAGSIVDAIERSAADGPSGLPGT